MPKLRRLSGSEVLSILEDLGFIITRVKGSHYRLKLSQDDRTCFTTVPVHGHQPIPTGTLHAILRQIAGCIAEDQLQQRFYTD